MEWYVSFPTSRRLPFICLNLRRLALSLILIPPPNRKYKPGNVKLAPERLVKHQHYAKAQLGDACDTDKPIFLVMHGGSGSTDEEIHAAVDAGTRD